MIQTLKSLVTRTNKPPKNYKNIITTLQRWTTRIDSFNNSSSSVSHPWVFQDRHPATSKTWRIIMMAKKTAVVLGLLVCRKRLVRWCDFISILGSSIFNQPKTRLEKIGDKYWLKLKVNKPTKPLSNFQQNLLLKLLVNHRSFVPVPQKQTRIRFVSIVINQPKD